MLLLKAHNSNYQTYFGLFYNPGGEERQDYNWMIPFKLFDMYQDECVLIGKDFWNTIGGKNTYADLIEFFSEVGAYTKQRIIEQG